MIPELFLWFVLVAASVVFHEIGHLIYIKKYGGKAELTFFKGDFEAKIPEGLNKDQEKEIIRAGLIGGCIPLFYMVFVLEPIYLLLACAVYMLGIKHDIRLMRGLEVTKEE